MSAFVEVKTADLIGPALDWVVMTLDGFRLVRVGYSGIGPEHDEDFNESPEQANLPNWFDEATGHSVGAYWVRDDDRLVLDAFWPRYSFQTANAASPSTDWNIGGPLIKKYGVLLSPPASMVHRNYGPYDKRNGYYESGLWSTTIFAKERKHRRAGFSHESDPLIPAMRAIVQFELGDVVSVPAELMP